MQHAMAGKGAHMRPDEGIPPDFRKALKAVRDAAATHGGNIRTSFDWSIPVGSLGALLAGTSIIGVVPTPGGAAGLFSFLGSLPSVLTTTVSFTGGALFALKFLREARLLIVALIEAKSRV
jgi:hypothetical protein